MRQRGKLAAFARGYGAPRKTKEEVGTFPLPFFDREFLVADHENPAGRSVATTESAAGYLLVSSSPRGFRPRIRSRKSWFRAAVVARVSAKYVSRMRPPVRPTDNEEAKYEHAVNNIGKTRESSWLLQGRAPKRRDSRLDCPRRGAGATAEVSGVFGRLSDDGNRNQYFCCCGRESASVARCPVR